MLTQLPVELLRSRELEVRGDRAWGGIFSTPDASFMPCRYLLWMLFDPLFTAAEPDWAHFHMLNPSVAEPGVPDNTFKKVCSFARRWGRHGVLLTNLDPRISTDPKGLQGRAPDGALKWNQLCTQAAAAASGSTVCAWGMPQSPRKLQRHVEVVAFTITKSGQPGHPLYLPGDLIPLHWAVPT